METNICVLCLIKKETFIHIMIFPDEVTLKSDFFENIYNVARKKVQNIKSQPVCEACQMELKIAQTFRKNCLFSEHLIEEISSKLSDNHRVLIENLYIDVTLYKSLNECYVYPVNVVQKDVLEEVEIKENEVEHENAEEEIENSDDIIYDPIESEIEEIGTQEEEPETEVSLNETQTEVPAEIVENKYEIEPKKSFEFKCDKCKKSYKVLSTLHMHRWQRHKIPLPNQLHRRQKLEIPSEKDIYYGLDLTKTCEYCFVECPNPEELKLHLDLFHQELPRKYTCKICQKTFKTRVTVRSHYFAIHTERRNFKCQYCDKMFFYKRSVQSHEEIQHLGVKGKFICDICGQTSNSRGDLNRHRLRHDKIKSHVCPYDQCGKRFLTKYQLTLHKKYHENIRNHQCTYCNRSFVTKSSLNDHIQVHLKEAKYFCDLCSSAFSRKRSLDKHLKVHYGIRDVLCDICPYKASTTDQMKSHKKVHEGFRPFSCLMCSMAFKDIGPLKRHLTMAHGISARGKDDDLDYKKTM
uniref:CSON009206 protein n=1 Tax=Culicoides sonorensis TaxID=179676 RepID=A0A336N2T6_CULSO